MNQVQSLFGIKIVIAPDRPKMQLAPGDYVTPEFRKEIDAWLVEFFGMTNLIPDGEILSIPNHGAVHMNPRTFAKVKAAAPKGEIK